MADDLNRETLLKELPQLLQSDPSLREAVLEIVRTYAPERSETDRRFDRILDELARDREEQSRSWDEQRVKWEEQNRNWEEQNRRWDEHRAELDQLVKKGDERWKRYDERWTRNDERWQRNDERWQRNDERWQRNDERIESMLAEIRSLRREFTSTIGALGARWGLYTEQSFRNALTGFLREADTDLEVERYTAFDEEGEVHGHPDQVELDIVVTNGKLFICEIKSSMSKADMWSFKRKARFYEKQRGRSADGLVVVSPMIDDAARRLGDDLGVKMYSFTDDVDFKEL